jgi:hypothetical protein
MLGVILLSLHDLRDKCGVSMFFDLVLRGCCVTLFLRWSWHSKEYQLDASPNSPIGMRSYVQVDEHEFVDWLCRFLKRFGKEAWLLTRQTGGRGGATWSTYTDFPKQFGNFDNNDGWSKCSDEVLRKVRFVITAAWN